jgi:hypothetical protein
VVVVLMALVAGVPVLLFLLANSGEVSRALRQLGA